MAASLIIALQTIQVEKDRKISPSITYEMLRKTIREHVGYKQGIPPYILAETITFFTNGTVSFHMLQVTDKSWDAYLTKELSLGYPLIVHMSDRDMLFQKKLPEDASHVIVVYGIDDTYVYFSDSWDGKTHRVFKEDFAEAWGGGKYPWWAFPLRFSEATL